MAGDRVLHSIHRKRYMTFYHCNTTTFVALVVVIIIFQSKQLSAVRRTTLKTAMTLDQFGLMGAYVARSCRDNTTTVYISALVLAIAVFVYAIAKVMAYTTQERKRKFLLQLAILAATITYQSGLNLSGGFWTENNGDMFVRASNPILLNHYEVRYQVFFYCNATEFMASVAVILLLMTETLSKPGIRSKALHVCIMVGLLGLMGAYTAGSCRLPRTSIYVFALVVAVVAFLVLEILFYMYVKRHNLSKQPWVS